MNIVYVMLSGGIDSTTALVRARECTCISIIRAVSFDYGQRHRREIEAATTIADYYGVEHEILKLSMPQTMLTDQSIEVPSISYAEIRGVSPTYVPFRNGLMLSRLTSHIVGRHLDPLRQSDPEYGADCQIWWGGHADDAENWAYPDCTIEFIGAMACAIYVGTYHRVRLVAPFAQVMKHEIIQHGASLGAPYNLTHSCYEGGEYHCGRCSTCRARRAAFDRAGVVDPTVYDCA